MASSIGAPPRKLSTIQNTFVPLIVGYNEGNKLEWKQVKLLDKGSIQKAIEDSLQQYESLKDKDSTTFAFKLKSTNQYINEKNRAELLVINSKNTFYEVYLCANIQTDVKMQVDKLSSIKTNSGDSLIKQLEELENNLNDKNYACEFFAQKGKSALMNYINNFKESTDATQWNILYWIYRILFTFFRTCNISWDSPEVDLLIIDSMISKLNSSAKENKDLLISDPFVLLILNTVNEIIIKSEQMKIFCLKGLKFADIIFLIKRNDLKIKASLLILFNNSFKLGDSSLKMNLFEYIIHTAVNNALKLVIFRERTYNLTDADLEGQIMKNLAILQKNILNIRCNVIKKELEDRSVKEELVKIIVDNAFQMSVNNKLCTYEEKYARLGFTKPKDPLFDFDGHVSSLMALKFMFYFSESSSFKSILQILTIEKSPKSSDYTFPFGKACTALVKMLYEMLELGTEKPPEEKFELIFLIFYQNDGLNEFFSKTLCLFLKLWNEMKAQMLDFNRALLVCKESILRILSDKNKLEKDNLSKINDFLASLDTWKYDNIKTLNLTEKPNKEPVKELKQILTNEIIEMIKPKRIHLLCKGQTFEMKILPKDKEKKGKQKYSFWKLSSDLKEFSFKDNDNNDHDSRSGTILIECIKDVKKDDSKKEKQSISYIQLLCETIDRQGEETYLLGNQNDEIIDIWLDAINMVLNPKATPNITCFVECISDTQLLDIQTLGKNE